jgi:Ca2+/Na+ antiporter
MILIIILKIIITIFIKNDINFLKLDLSLIYMVYIYVVFFMFILYRNLRKTKDALDSISLDNINLTLYLKYLC